MRNKAYVGIGSVAMASWAPSLNPEFYQKYLGIRANGGHDRGFCAE